MRDERAVAAAASGSRHDHAAWLRPAAAAGQPAVHRFALLVALSVNLLPLGRPWLPDLLAVVLVFWNVHQPRRVGMGMAFLFGLLMDVPKARCSASTRWPTRC